MEICELAKTNEGASLPALLGHSFMSQNKAKEVFVVRNDVLLKASFSCRLKCSLSLINF